MSGAPAREGRRRRAAMRNFFFSPGGIIFRCVSVCVCVGGREEHSEEECKSKTREGRARVRVLLFRSIVLPSALVFYFKKKKKKTF